MEIRRRQRYEAMVESLTRRCDVSKEKVIATINPETLPPAEPLRKSVVRGDVILIEGRAPAALEVRSIDAQIIAVSLHKEGAEPVERKLKQGNILEIWKGSVGLSSADNCTLIVRFGHGGIMELRSEINEGLMPF